VSSPITVIGARQHGHAVSSGNSVTSMRGRCAGQRAAVRAPSGRVAFAQLGILLLGLRLIFGDRLLEGFEAQLQLVFRQTFGPGTEPHPCQLQQQMAQPVILYL
jgi:hypothetical protein